MPTIVLDLDGTLTMDDAGVPYQERHPNTAVVAKLKQYKNQGFQIAIYTARNMKTHDKSLGKITALTVPIIIDWLNAHEIPFDEIYVGKPWADAGGFYVDDRAIRPDEFVKLTHPEIMTLIGAPLQ